MAYATCDVSGPDDMEDSDNSSMDIVPSSLSIAKNLGVDAPHIQLQKASFFAADDDDDDDYFGYSKQKGWLLLEVVNVLMYMLSLL